MNDQTPTDYVRPKDIDNRASFWPRIQWRLETVAWDLIYWGPMKMLGPDRASNFGGWLMRKIGPLLSQHKTMRRNLRLAFPDWDAAKIEQAALDAWDSAGRTAGELPHLPAIDPYTSGRVEIAGLDVLDRIRDSGKGAVFVSGHFANWEIMPVASVDRLPVGNGQTGPVTSRIAEAYRRVVTGQDQRHPEWRTPVWGQKR